MSSFIQIHNLSFSYEKELILDRLNASFLEGKLSVILGRNGSGKSTLFNILVGLQRKYVGQVFFGGTERKKLRYSYPGDVRIGFLNQFHQTTFPFTVREVLLTGRASFHYFAPSKKDYMEVEAVLDRFQLSNLIDKEYTSLSGGERQLILLSRVLLQKPNVLILDEPTNHLDLHYQIAVLNCIKQLSIEGTTILCVMHDPNLALMYGDQFYIMQNKQLVDVQYVKDGELKKLLEDTYQLPLVESIHQGKPIFLPEINLKV